jgi:hypothetical protein
LARYVRVGERGLRPLDLPRRRTCLRRLEETDGLSGGEQAVDDQAVDVTRLWM